MKWRNSWSCSLKVSVFFMLPVLGILCGLPLSAQCPIDQIFSNLMFVDGKDTVHGSDLFPLWRFAMTYDSAQVQYEIIEFERNHARIKLGNWCGGQELEEEVEDLIDSSFTESFVVQTNDTISFYRQLIWTAPYDGGPSNGFYYALDTLDFTVELVEDSTGSRVLLDSIGALREVPSGYPDFYGTHPVMAIVKYRVPAGLNGRTMHVRVRPYARGNGQYKTLRVDGVSTRRSSNLNEPFFIDYLNAYGGGAKVAVRYLEEVANLGNALHASFVPSRGNIEVRYDGISSVDGDVGLALMNVKGEQVFLFAGHHRADEPLQTSYHVQESGLYFVVLLDKGSPVSSIKVVVSK